MRQQLNDLNNYNNNNFTTLSLHKKTQLHSCHVWKYLRPIV